MWAGTKTKGVRTHSGDRRKPVLCRALGLRKVPGAGGGEGLLPPPDKSGGFT